MADLGFETTTQMVRAPWGADLTFTIRADRAEADRNVIGEVVTGDTYRIASMERAPRIVFDIGGHIGTFTRSITSRFPGARVWVVEPSIDNHALLTANVGDI